MTDPEAFAGFYREHVRAVMVFFMRRTFDPELSLDLCSETFALALERRKQFRGRSAAEEQGWLFAIARNVLQRYWRRGQVERAAMERMRIEAPVLVEGESERFHELAGTQQLRLDVAAALSALPPDQSYAVRQRILRERSYAELAAELEQSEQVIRARVSRGLRAIAARLGDRPVEEFA